MQEAQERRKRLKSLRDDADVPEAHATGTGKLINPLLNELSNISSSPAFSFYSDPLAALKSSRPQPPRASREGRDRGQNGAAPLGSAMAPAPQLLPRPPASFQPGFQRPVQASWAQPGGPPQHPPGAYGQPWGPPPAFGPSGSQAAQWNGRPVRPPAYNSGGPRPPPGPPPPGPPHPPGLLHQGRWYNSGGGRGGGARQSQDGSRGRGRGGPPGRGRSGRGRGEGRGEAGIEAYYSPSMVEDPWRSLRQPQDSALQQKGDEHLTEGRPSPVVQEAKEADAAGRGPAEGAESSKLSDDGVQDRPWH